MHSSGLRLPQVPSEETEPAISLPVPAASSLPIPGWSLGLRLPIPPSRNPIVSGPISRSAGSACGSSALRQRVSSRRWDAIVASPHACASEDLPVVVALSGSVSMGACYWVCVPGKPTST